MRHRFQLGFLPLLALAWPLALPLWAASPAASPASVPATVEVTSGVVRVADLVPGAAAAQAAFVLGPAPQPGAPLVWSRAQVLVHLEDAGFAPDAVSVPAEVVISRHAVPVARAAVVAALAAYLGHPVPAAAVNFTPPLTTVNGDPGVVVESAHLDAIRGWVEARCRLRRDPALLPFTVFVQPTAGDGAAKLAARRRQALTAWQPPAPPLVQPGHQARLLIDRSGFSIVTAVMPLQAGANGAHIRAESLATHAILRVQVSGKNQVRLDDAQ